MDASIDKEIENMEHEILPREAKDIGLKFFTTINRGWPQDNFTIDDLINRIKHKKYK